MKPITLSAIFAAGLLLGFSDIVVADPIEKKGTAPYVTHFIFRPLQTLDVSGVGTSTGDVATGLSGLRTSLLGPCSFLVSGRRALRKICKSGRHSVLAKQGQFDQSVKSTESRSLEIEPSRLCPLRARGVAHPYSPTGDSPAGQATHERRGPSGRGCRRVLVRNLMSRSCRLCNQPGRGVAETQPF